MGKEIQSPQYDLTSWRLTLCLGFELCPEWQTLVIWSTGQDILDEQISPRNRNQNETN